MQQVKKDQATFIPGMAFENSYGNILWYIGETPEPIQEAFYIFVYEDGDIETFKHQPKNLKRRPNLDRVL